VLNGKPTYNSVGKNAFMFDVEKWDQLQAAAVHPTKKITQSALLGNKISRNRITQTPAKNMKTLSEVEHARLGK
jgi:putative protein kinase ArgK-like GTPase of G3E family